MSPWPSLAVLAPPGKGGSWHKWGCPQDSSAGGFLLFPPCSHSPLRFLFPSNSFSDCFLLTPDLGGPLTLSQSAPCVWCDFCLDPCSSLFSPVSPTPAPAILVPVPGLPHPSPVPCFWQPLPCLALLCSALCLQPLPHLHPELLPHWLPLSCPCLSLPCLHP